MRCYPEQFYTPPPGMCDFPFIYSFDLLRPLLVDHGNYLGQRLQLEGDSEFLLRAVGGQMLALHTGGTVQLYDALLRPFFSAPARLSNALIHAVLPEKRYPRSGQIVFDLVNVNTAIPFSKLHFQGVKRYPGRETNPKPSLYDYKEKMWDWVITPNIILSQTPGTVVSGSLLVEDFDFELEEILATDLTTNAPSLANFLFRIWDPDQPPRCMMDRPILDVGLLSNFDTASQAFLLFLGNFTTCFPCPPVLYPRGSILRYELTSLGTGNSVQLVFRGVRRVPC